MTNLPQRPDAIAQNPYLPTASIEQDEDGIGVSRIEIGLRVAAAHILAGTSVIVATVGTISLLVGFTDLVSWADFLNALAINLGIAAVAGIAIYTVASVIIVPIFVILFASRSFFGGDRWDRRSLSNFARVSGLMVGWIPCIAYSMMIPKFIPWVILFGIIPGVVVAILSPLFIRGLLRKAANLSASG